MVRSRDLEIIENFRRRTSGSTIHRSLVGISPPLPGLSAGRAEMSIGMRWHIRHATGRNVVGHNGGTGGYRTWMGFDKSRKVAAIVLTNSTPGNDDLGFELVLGPGSREASRRSRLIAIHRVG